jgi:hypothetical protein
MKILDAVDAIEKVVNARLQDLATLTMVHNSARVLAKEVTEVRVLKNLDRLIIQLEIQLNTLQKISEIKSKFDGSEKIIESIIKYSSSDENIPSSLTAAEIALMHHYLVKAKIEKYLNPRQVGLKYKNLKSAKNIQMAYSKFDKNEILPNKVQLENLESFLSDYPTVQKAIRNDIDKL